MSSRLPEPPPGFSYTAGRGFMSFGLQSSVGPGPQMERVLLLWEVLVHSLQFSSYHCTFFLAINRLLVFIYFCTVFLLSSSFPSLPRRDKLYVECCLDMGQTLGGGARVLEAIVKAIILL